MNNAIVELARSAILSVFTNKKIHTDNLGKFLTMNKACFVTLTINGKLRGCIGTLNDYRPLYVDVIENAKAAAFHDPRFAPLSSSEVSQIMLEVSVLSKSIKLKNLNKDDLLAKLTFSMGVILNYNDHCATFLPQVWNEIPDKIEFLEALALKAGLDKNDWKKSEFEVYYVETYKE